MKRPCKTCPFVEGTENIGSAEWLTDVMKGIKQGSLDHTCHCTDPKADGYVAGDPGHCWGYLGMLKAADSHCYGPKTMADTMSGKLNWDDISTDGVFRRVWPFIEHHGRKIFGKKWPF